MAAELLLLPPPPPPRPPRCVVHGLKRGDTDSQTEIPRYYYPHVGEKPDGNSNATRRVTEAIIKQEPSSQR